MTINRVSASALTSAVILMVIGTAPWTAGAAPVVRAGHRGARSAIVIARTVRAGSSRVVSLESLLREMTDRSALARRPNPAFVLKQISSHDPAKRDPADQAAWHSNHDYEQFLHTETIEGRHEWVIMDEVGPGAITRFWLPLNADRDKQVIRFYFDGAPKPAISVRFNDLLSGRDFVKPPFAFVAWNDTDVSRQKGTTPAVLRGVAGDLYLPIPFARRCKITLDEMPFYYIIDYRAYSPGTRVRTFAMEDFEAAQGTLAHAADLLASDVTLTHAADILTPKGASTQAADLLFSPGRPAAKPSAVSGTIPPGGQIKLDLPAGSHAVRDLTVQIDPKDAPQVLRSLVITASFDDMPAIWCPIGEFFGAGARLRPVHDRFRTVREDGLLSSEWVMPYRRTAAVTLVNDGSVPVTVTLTASAESRRWDDRSLYFHADWHCSLGMKTRPRTDWNYIDIQGDGQYVGDTLTVFSPVREWYGEGDERIYIDGETFPSHIGTGTEDYYGYAWGMAGFFSSPFLSTPHRDLDDRGDWRGYTTTSRLRLLDAIPLTTALRVDMEVWHWADTLVDYAVGTFWYGRPGAKDNRAPQAAEAAATVHAAPALPARFKIEGALECEDLRILNKSMGVATSIQNAGLHAGQWSGGRQLFVQASTAGDFVELEIPAGDDRPRRLILYATRSFDYGTLRFVVNGKQAGADFDAYSNEPEASGPIDLGIVTPKTGKLVLRIEVKGANPAARGKRTYFGLDCVAFKYDQ